MSAAVEIHLSEGRVEMVTPKHTPCRGVGTGAPRFEARLTP